MAAKKKRAAKKPARQKRAKTGKKPAKKSAGAAVPVARATRNATEKVAAGERAHAGIQHYAWRRDHYKTLGEFWPFYLHEHSSARNRMLHFIGSSLGLAVFLGAIITGTYVLFVVALISGYAFAWFGHYFIEKNRPATLQYPLKSFLSDWRMWYEMLTGRIAQELRKYGIQSRQ